MDCFQNSHRFQVIYTGLRQTPEMIVKTAIEEGADLIGISILSGSHMTLLLDIVQLLDQNHAGEIDLIAGGIIPSEDIPLLKERGIKEIFLPETRMAQIIACVRAILEKKE